MQPEMPHLACCKLLILPTWYNFWISSNYLKLQFYQITASVLKWDLMQLDVCRYLLKQFAADLWITMTTNLQQVYSCNYCKRFIINKISAYWYRLVSNEAGCKMSSNTPPAACMYCAVYLQLWLNIIKQQRALLVWMTLTCSRHVHKMNSWLLD